MSSGRHHLAADPQTMSRRSAFNSLRKMPSTLFRSEKASAPTDDNPQSLRETKKPRRRALAGLLGRGKHNMPPVPPPSAWTAETQMNPSPGAVPENKQRPSCGPDPFVRPVPEGVRVVQHAYSPPPKPKSVKIMEAERHNASRSTKRQSATSSLRGIQVISIDEVDNLDDPLIDDGGAALASLINGQGTHGAQSALPDLRAEELPQRNASLGTWPKLSHIKALAEDNEPAETSPVAVPVHTVVGRLADTVDMPKPRLAKEKTRSKVWGVLSGKRQSKSKSKAEAPSGKMAQGAGRSSNSESTRPPSRTRPPTLHITHPSLDQQIPPPTAPARQVIADPDSPFVARKSATPTATHLNPLLDAMRQSSDSYASRATSRKSVPKRKSLAGLFGITFQKSMDKLRSGEPSPSPVPAMPAEPSTPSRMSINANVMDDTSPDTLAFYSRQGTRSGFNGFGTLLHPDALIHDVTSANTHLHELVSHMDVSPTMTRSRGAPGTPTPLRGQQSSMLVARPNSAQSRSATPSPSRSIVRPIGKVFERQAGSKTPNGSRPSSPVKTMVRGMRNIFTSSPSRLPAKVTPSPFRPDSVASDMSDTSAASTNHIVIQVAERGNSANRRSGLDVPHDVNDRPSPESARTVTPRAPPPPPSAFAFGHTRIGSKPPTLDLDFGTPSRPTSMFSDMFGQINGSKLSMASNASSSANTRDSKRNTFDFAKELAALKASDDEELVGDTLRIARSIEFSTESPRDALSQLEEVLESRKNSAETLRGRQRRSNPPFQGGIAFQMNVARSRNNALQHPGPPPPLPLPPTPPAVRLGSDHKKQPSAISFASMSSLGTPLVHIDRGHPSYFDQAFASGAPRPPLPNLPNHLKALEGSHHRRMSSGLSIDSATIAEISVVTGRSIGCARGHRRESSRDSTVGRSDWAHQRRTSTDSVGSVARLCSIARLGRPGLGDRMFERNGLVDDEDSDADMSALASPTFGPRRYSQVSTDETHELASTEESFFGKSDVERQRSFSIKGRPLSTASVESNVNDTFAYIDGPSKRGAVEVDIIGRYENDSVRASPVVKNTSIKPRARQRPPRLHLHDDEDDTPGLISPSDLTESSSLFSIDTCRTSNPPPGYPSHTREQGSITSIIQIQPTIREEASQATMRGDGDHNDTQAEWQQAQDWHSRKWNEAGHGQPSISRSPAYTNLNEPPMPRNSRAEIDAILADSMARYKPLGETTHANVHRRKTSISSTRSIVGPYGLNNPAPFETRFQNKRAAISGENVSPLLAAFARDVVPLPPLPSAHRPAAKSTASTADTGVSTADVRTRVPSSVRRDNLGWGRRRHSDEPTTSEPSVILRKKPASATQASFPSFLAFSPQPTQQGGHKVKSKPACSRPPSQPKPLRLPQTTATKGSRLQPPPVPAIPQATKPKPSRKRIHVKTDSKGSPVSVHSLPPNLIERPDSAPAPLTSRAGNVSKPTRTTLHKTKSSPEARRVNKKSVVAADKENMRGAYVLPPVPRRGQYV